MFIFNNTEKWEKSQQSLVFGDDSA